MLGSSPVKRVTFFTIGKEASEIDYAVDEHSIYVTVLDINLWGILQMGI